MSVSNEVESVDGLLLWFGAPDVGLSGALAIHASVDDAHSEGTLPLAMRMGLHYGEVPVRGDDLVGLTVNTAARIVALAGPIRVEGLRTPIWLHRVASQRAGPARPPLDGAVKHTLSRRRLERVARAQAIWSRTTRASAATRP